MNLLKEAFLDLRRGGALHAVCIEISPHGSAHITDQLSGPRATVPTGYEKD